MNYSIIGLKAGLEIHQQLNTGKLFSRCDSKLTKDMPDTLLKRKLRATTGESGKIDIAAVFETSKNLDYIYEVHNSNTSLIETDEEPPLEIDEEALSIIYTVCRLLNCNIVPFIQIMRKTVIDGSNTSGFQRTCLVGTDGYIETSKGKVSIESVILEEDSARRVSEDKNSVTYRLDRLGIPLIEITTAPDMHDPDHIKETAQKIGMILRSTGKVKRGIGTIRQDVNISISGGNRVELKGVQEISAINKIVNNEIERQQDELSMNRKVGGEVRNVKSDTTSKFLRPMPTSARMYPETDLPTIQTNFKKINSIKLPELISSRIERYLKIGLNKELSSMIANSSQNNIFDKILETKINPTLIATTILSTSKEIKRKLKIDSWNFPDEFYCDIFSFLADSKITKDSIPKIMERFTKGETLEKIVKDYKPISDSELKKIVSETIKENSKLPQGALIGKIMEQITGRADGKKVAKIIGDLTK